MFESAREDDLKGDFPSASLAAIWPPCRFPERDKSIVQLQTSMSIEGTFQGSTPDEVVVVTDAGNTMNVLQNCARRNGTILEQVGVPRSIVRSR